MKILNFCKPYLLSHKYTLTAYIAITLSSTAIGILSPYIIGVFIDNLTTGADVRTILHFCVIFGGLNLIKIFKGYITTIMHIKMATKMSYSLNMDAITHIQGLSLSYINVKDSVYLSQRLSNDSSSLIIFCITILQNIVINVIMLIAPLAILLTMNWFISVLMIGFLAVYVAIYFAFKEPLYNVGFAFMEAQAKLFSGLFEQLKYIKLIKISSIQKEMNRKADDSFMNLRDTAVRRQKFNYLYSGLEGFVSTIAQIVLFVVGGLQILAGNFTIGMFTIFTSYFNMMLGASRYFSSLGSVYQDTLTAYDRMKDIFDQRPESCGTKIISDIDKIELRNVSFSYLVDASEKDSSSSQGSLHSTGSKKIINNFNAEFTKGKIYAIVGANGSGKSTLVSLIMGLYIDEYGGSITYDGMDIRHIDMVVARKNLLGFSEQEPILINDSIRYNLDFSDKEDENGSRNKGDNRKGSNKKGNTSNNKNNEDIRSLEEYINILDMENFISARTLDFKINEKNTNTSGGEKQKISILKVLYRNPDVMIFDEPTSALDSKSTEKFIEYLQQIKRDKIIIIITHDEVVKGYCDEVICLS